MSRVRIIKNHSTMLDDWFSSLMILACEKDVIDRISDDEIIDGFAGKSTPLQKCLILQSIRFSYTCIVFFCFVVSRGIVHGARVPELQHTIQFD